MTPINKNRKKSGFTLIELLVVIAILAVLAVVVVLTLNPAGLLQESRDANRLQDMATLNNAIGYSLADNSSESLGSANTVYVSVPDPSATSTAGDQCQGLGLSALPASDTYQCANAANYRSTSGNGWIPINLSSLSFGTPLSELPIDPVNATSSGLYYTYGTNGSQFEVASIFESQKYKLQYGTNPLDPDYPEVDAKGSNLTVDPLYNPSGLVGWWPLNEGSGTTALDQSGSGNNGTWQGSTPYYSSNAKVGSYAGNFNGSNSFVSSTATGEQLTAGSVVLWFARKDLGREFLWSHGADGAAQDYDLIQDNTGTYYFRIFNNSDVQYPVYWSVPGLTLGTWYQVAVTWNASNTMSLYHNGALVGTGSVVYPTAFGNTGQEIGASMVGGSIFNGSIDDVHIYNRALSAAEIQALYNAEK